MGAVGETDFGMSSAAGRSHQVSISSSTTFRTDEHEAVTDGYGDLYVGGSLAFNYAPTDALTADTEQCALAIVTSVVWSEPEIDQKTMYVYTEREIRDLISALKIMQTYNQSGVEVDVAGSIAAWETTLLQKQVNDKKLVAPGTHYGTLMMAELKKANPYIKALKSMLKWELVLGFIPSRVQFLVTNIAIAIAMGLSFNVPGVHFQVKNLVLFVKLMVDLSKVLDQEESNVRNKRGALLVRVTSALEDWEAIVNDLQAAVEAHQQDFPSITFNAGAAMDKTLEVVRSESMTYDFELAVSSGLGSASEGDAFIFDAESTFLHQASFVFAPSINRGTEQTSSVTYTLADGDVVPTSCFCLVSLS